VIRVTSAESSHRRSNGSIGQPKMSCCALYESLYTPDIWLEINCVLEDNVPMNNAIKKLNAKPLRRYRIYQREI
jgi:hypothetical protein